MPAEAPLLYHELLGDGHQRVFAVERVLARHRTATGQRVDLVELVGYGASLFIDGVRQSSAADEHVYHEMLVQPALFAARTPVREVLIAGGGEGATAREVLRHRSVERVVQVDLDPELIGLCREHLPSFSAGAYDDSRFELVVDDIGGWLQRNDRRFDAIVLDIPEDDGSDGLQALYGAAFHALVRAHLAPGGTVSSQLGPVHPVRAALLGRFAERWSAAHRCVDWLVAPELGWVFAVAGDGPLAPPEAARFDAALHAPCRYYSPELHRRLAYAPPHLSVARRAG
ncbi:MAG: hypothetical protein R3F59_27935 [Myxococcota bacterium]